MNKGGMERLADLANTARNIANIIKAGLKGGWAGAALEALKAYWPKALPIALVLFLLPAIILCSLPAMVFGFDEGESEAEKLRLAYDEHIKLRDEQIFSRINNYDGKYTIEDLGESFDKNWLIAIHSVEHDNDTSKMSVENLKELIGRTYTYEIVDTDEKPAEPEPTKPINPDEDRETEPGRPTEPEPTNPNSPWEEEHCGSDNGGETSYNPDPEDSKPKPTKIIKVKTKSPKEVIEAIMLDSLKIEWAETIYESLSDYGEDTLKGEESNE